MQTRIQGTTMPVLDVQLDPNESVFSESGELSWMTGSIQMTTHTQMGGGGGLFGVLKRVAGGGSLFMTEYRAVQYPGTLVANETSPGYWMARYSVMNRLPPPATRLSTPNSPPPPPICVCVVI